LEACGYSLSSLVEEEGREVRSLSIYEADKASADRIYKIFKGFKAAGVSIFRCVHRESDWSSRWKKCWKPFSLTRRFHVIPLWQEVRVCPARKIPVYLDTTNAFGTGLHETTRFTAQVIESLTGKFSSFLDVGTGSGILAIVALKCGAKKCVGFDIDPSAVRVARQNLRANQLTCQLTACDVKDFKPVKLFDLVAANLVSFDLIQFRDRILSFVQPGGYLVISGVSLKNIVRVKKAFAQAGVYPVRLVQGREWAAIVFHPDVIRD